MTNEEFKNDQALLEKAVEEAVATPAPLPELKSTSYLHQTCTLYKGVKKNVFPVGKKPAVKMELKKDTAGLPLVHGNGGEVYLKDYSHIKFWHNGELISKAEHDELTNGVGK